MFFFAFFFSAWPLCTPVLAEIPSSHSQSAPISSIHRFRLLLGSKLKTFIDESRDFLVAAQAKVP
jgi:hypothetical protein